MTHPPSPLAALLEPLSAIRQALAYLPRILAAGDPLYALEVLEEQIVQLQEWADEVERHAEANGPWQPQLHPDDVGASRVISSAAAGDLPELDNPRLTRPGGPPAGKADIDYVDVSLW